MMIGSIVRLESRTSPENYDKNSMSFYGYTDVNDMAWVMSHKEILIVHTNNKTEESKKMVVNGLKLFNSLEVRTFRKKKVLIYRY